MKLEAKVKENKLDGDSGGQGEPVGRGESKIGGDEGKGENKKKCGVHKVKLKVKVKVK